MRHLSIVATVLALCFAVPASAQGAALTFGKPCFAAVPGTAPDQPITFTLTGGTPGYNWRVNTNDFNTLSVVEARGTFDANGNATGAFTSYSLRGLNFGINPTRGRQAAFTATQGPSLFGQTPIAQATATVTNAALSISRGRAFRKRTWRVSGLNPLYGPSNTYYASWVKGSKGKRVVKRVRLGRAKGACGYLAVKRVLPPARRAGAWTAYVHQGRKLNKRRAIAFPFRVFVF
jgi:hypothetical protein